MFSTIFSRIAARLFTLSIKREMRLRRTERGLCIKAWFSEFDTQVACNDAVARDWQVKTLDAVTSWCWSMHDLILNGPRRAHD